VRRESERDREKRSEEMNVDEDDKTRQEYGQSLIECLFGKT